MARKNSTRTTLAIIGGAILLIAAVLIANQYFQARSQTQIRSQPITDEFIGSIRCATQSTTICSVTLTNNAASHHQLDWSIKKTTPANASALPNAGTLQPGETANIQITYSITAGCQNTVTFSYLYESSEAAKDFPLGWNCPG